MSIDRDTLPGPINMAEFEQEFPPTSVPISSSQYRIASFNPRVAIGLFFELAPDQVVAPQEPPFIRRRGVVTHYLTLRNEVLDSDASGNMVDSGVDKAVIIDLVPNRGLRALGSLVFRGDRGGRAFLRDDYL